MPRQNAIHRELLTSPGTVADALPIMIRALLLVLGTFGSPRIHGELRMLGLDVSERTVSRYLPRRRPRPDAMHRWLVFQPPRDGRGDGLVHRPNAYVPCPLRLVRCRARTTTNPSVCRHRAPGSVMGDRTAREAFPFGPARCHLIFDRDSTFSASVVSTVKTFGSNAILACSHP